MTAQDRAIAYEPVRVEGEGLTLSLLVWRRFKRHMPGMVERILDRQGEFSEAIYLPVGAVVEFPIDPPPTGGRRRAVVSLWD